MNDLKATSAVIGVGFLATIVTAARYIFHLTQQSSPRRSRAYLICWVVRGLIEFATNGILLGFMWNFTNLDYGSWALVVCIWLNMFEEVLRFFQHGFEFFTLLFSPTQWDMKNPKFRAIMVVVLAAFSSPLVVLLGHMLPPSVVPNMLMAIGCVGHHLLTVYGTWLLAGKLRAILLLRQLPTIVPVMILGVVSICCVEGIYRLITLASALITAKITPLALDLICKAILPAVTKTYVATKKAFLQRKQMVNSTSELSLVSACSKAKAVEGDGHGSMV